MWILRLFHFFFAEFLDRQGDQRVHLSLPQHLGILCSFSTLLWALVLPSCRKVVRGGESYYRAEPQLYSYKLVLDIVARHLWGHPQEPPQDLQGE
jgi:hypothetical protein